MQQDEVPIWQPPGDQCLGTGEIHAVVVVIDPPEASAMQRGHQPRREGEQRHGQPHSRGRQQLPLRPLRRSTRQSGDEALAHRRG